MLLKYEDKYWFSKCISMKKFDYVYQQTAVINHLEIIYLHCLGIVLFILLHFAFKLTIFILGLGFFCFGETTKGGGVVYKILNLTWLVMIISR